MSFPPPTEKQARVIWFSLTALAVAAMILLGGLVIWAFGAVANKLASVIFPLAIAGIFSYLLDPLVDFLERRRVPRTRAILLVFFALVMVMVILLATVVPQLIVEIKSLVQQMPDYAVRLRDFLTNKLAMSPWADRAREAMATDLGASLQNWLATAAPIVGGWIFLQFQRAASWIGFIVGLALVPVYLFYFLQEKSGIQRSWTDYLPLNESKAKDEVVFVLTSINDALIVFFRGQVLVALCTGTILTIAFFVLGLNYAILLGAVAAILGIMPYVGSITCLLLALILSAVQFGDWLHPLLVLAIFGVVQLIEGFVISPKIIGDRVGMHPLTIIVAVLVGTTLMGGILGGVLAIPLTAALRTLMFRYVWKKRGV
ncbi:MAG: AI-2E family transporter [Verrucomicrobiota bacterium]